VVACCEGLVWLVTWASKLSRWWAIVSMQLQASMVRVWEVWANCPGNQDLDEKLHKGGWICSWRPSNVDAYCLARSSVNFLVGRHNWFVAPFNGVYTSYPDE
jgi:hypothetical protein